MDRSYPNLMWSEACAMLLRAERLHRQVFRPTKPAELGPAWEPPVDILETDQEVLVFVGLPGVDADQVETIIDDGDLLVAGTRQLPSVLRTAAIHRLELPQGRFERRIRLPAGRYQRVRRAMVDGCVLVTLEKMGVAHG
jgi:HSP20 family protein